MCPIPCTRLFVNIWGQLRGIWATSGDIWGAPGHQLGASGGHLGHLAGIRTRSQDIRGTVVAHRKSQPFRRDSARFSEQRPHGKTEKMSKAGRLQEL